MLEHEVSSKQFSRTRFFPYTFYTFPTLASFPTFTWWLSNSPTFPGYWRICGAGTTAGFVASMRVKWRCRSCCQI